MFNNINMIEALHIEPSSFCNAKCPLCYRFDKTNYPALESYIKPSHLDLHYVKKLIDKYVNIKSVLLNGSYGEPMMNPDILDFCKYLNNKNIKITIHTNGGLRNEKFWKEMAIYIKNNESSIRFSIDGLEDTNHIYRVDVNWDKLMNNVNSFIKNGGVAHWKFIEFKHNSHQVSQAKFLSKLLGFKKFIHIYNSSRGVNSDYTISDYAKKYHAGIYDVKKVNFECRAKKQKMIYIDYSGRVFPCTWTGHEFFNNKNKSLSLNEIEWKKINVDEISLYKNDITDILNSSIFNMVEENLNYEKSFIACEMKCKQNFQNYKKKYVN